MPTEQVPDQQQREAEIRARCGIQWRFVDGSLGPGCDLEHGHGGRHSADFGLRWPNGERWPSDRRTWDAENAVRAAAQDKED